MRPDPRGLLHDDEEDVEEQKNENDQEMKVVKKVKKGKIKVAADENDGKTEETK